MKFQLTFAAVAVALLAGTAMADEPRLSHSEGYSHYAFGEFDAHVGSGRLTYRFSDYFAVEGQLDTGFSGAQSIACPTGEDCTGIEPEARFRNGYSAHLMARFPVSERVAVFGRVGYGLADFKANIGPTGNDDGMMYGAGVEVFLNDEHGFRAEYSRADFDQLGETDVWGISYVRRF